MKEGIAQLDLSDLNESHYKSMEPIKAQEHTMETIGYSIDEFQGEYTVYCHKEDELGFQDSCYEMAGTEKEVMQFLSSRGIDDAWFFGLQSYYDLRG